MKLTAPAIRALGCLMEKKMATPEYYPLSLNALLNACNQKSSRNPVVSYDEAAVVDALDELKSSQLIWRSTEGRVEKYGENFTGPRKMTNAEAAVLCVLFLRGPQTIGELRTRTDRLHKFESLDEVKQALEELYEMELAVELPRAPGQKEQRCAHLLADEVDQPVATAEDASPIYFGQSAQSGSLGETVRSLTAEVEELKKELEELKNNFAQFSRQFE